MTEPVLVVEGSEWRLQSGRTVAFLAAPLRTIEGVIYRRWELQVWTDTGAPVHNRAGAVTFHADFNDNPDAVTDLAKTLILKIETERCAGGLTADRVQKILDTTVVRDGRPVPSARQDVLDWVAERLGRSKRPSRGVEDRPRCRPSHGVLAGYTEFCADSTCPNYGKETVC